MKLRISRHVRIALAAMSLACLPMCANAATDLFDTPLVSDPIHDTLAECLRPLATWKSEARLACYSRAESGYQNLLEKFYPHMLHVVGAEKRKPIEASQDAWTAYRNAWRDAQSSPHPALRTRLAWEKENVHMLQSRILELIAVWPGYEHEHETIFIGVRR